VYGPCKKKSKFWSRHIFDLAKTQFALKEEFCKTFLSCHKKSSLDALKLKLEDFENLEQTNNNAVVGN
jgi:hypothetical protein